MSTNGPRARANVQDDVLRTQAAGLDNGPGNRQAHGGLQARVVIETVGLNIESHRALTVRPVIAGQSDHSIRNRNNAALPPRGRTAGQRPLAKSPASRREADDRFFLSSLLLGKQKEPG